MSDELHATLAAWRAGPSSDGAIAVCRAVAGGLTTSPAHRACLAEAGPQLVAAHAADVEVMVALGALYLRASELLLADAVLKRILPIAQHDPRIWRLLGEVFLRAGNARDAVTAFDGATLRGMTDGATAAWRERAGSYVAMQDTHGAGAVSAAIAGAARAAGPAPAPAPAAQRGASPGPAADTETTRTMTPLVRAAEGRTPDSARTLVYQDGTGQPALDTAPTPVSSREPSSAPPRAPVSVPRPAPSVPRPAPQSAPRAGAMGARPSSGPGIGGGITATLASASSPVRDPETPRSPQLMPAVEPISARSSAAGQGGSAQASAAAPAETSIQPAGSTAAAEKAQRVSMRGAVSEGRDILDEISMSLHILRLDRAGMPQSDRDMERYLEGLRATQGLILDEPTLADERPPVHEDGHAGSGLHTAGNAHGGHVDLAPGPRPPFDPGFQPAQQAHPTQPLQSSQPLQPAAGGHAPYAPYPGHLDAVPTFQPVTGGGTLPMTSVRDVLRELEQAGPPPGPMPVPVTALRPSDAAGTLPRVVVQEPPRTMVGVGPAPAAGGPPPMAMGFGAGPLAPPRDASVPPAAGLAAPVGPGLVVSGPMLLARRPQKRSRAPLLVLVLVMLIVIAVGVGYAYLRYGGRL